MGASTQGIPNLFNRFFRSTLGCGAH
uniref:Uncharacterized protein n=1 Tax=Rhizophora mucronata TaxID=61149 RepID=A0A2P2QFR9_RHIMU